MTGRRFAIAVLGALLAVTAVACSEEDHGPLNVPASADADVGKQLIQSYGCGTCHTIPDVAGADGRVGPSLEDFGHQMYIAGAVPNDWDNLVAWLMDPQAIEPGTIMPNFGMGETTAANVAAYLASLK